MRLHALSITAFGPFADTVEADFDALSDAGLFLLSGPTGAGKSSVLNSLAMALGGKELVPIEPIRAGETEAKITVDLGDFVVTRRFMRDIIKEQAYSDRIMPGVAVPAHVLQSRQFGETRSTLVVANKDGAKYPSPQAMLDKLLGKLTFDPLAFSRDDEKKQAETLRRLVGLDVSKFEAARKTAYDQRTMAKKSLEIKAAQLQALLKHEGTPEAEISMDEISKEMLQAEEYRKLAEDAERQVEIINGKIIQYGSAKQTIAAKLEALLLQMNALRLEYDGIGAASSCV